jgi:hypothetical protein
VAAVVELEEGVGVRRERPVRREQEKAAGHAQVRDEHAPAVELEEDVLAAPRDRLDARAAQEPRERARGDVGREARPQEPRRVDAPAACVAVEGARDEFDLGEFGHLSD